MTNENEIATRVAAIDNPIKALAALRDVAYVGRLFNEEMARSVGRAADVLEATIRILAKERDAAVPIIDAGPRPKDGE